MFFKVRYVFFPKHEVRSLVGTLSEIKYVARDYAGLSPACHCLENAITSTTMKPLRRSKYMSGVFFYRRVFGNIDELGAAEETMSSNRLPLVIRIFVAVPLIPMRRTKRVPNVCTCRGRCKKRGRGKRVEGINKSIYSTFKRTGGRKRER